MAQDFVRNLASENRNRLVGALMGHFEREVAPLLPANERSRHMRAYRARVQAHVGQYHDFVLDLISAVPDDGAFNEDAMVMLREVHAGVARMRSGG